ncbi:MAG: Gfo/Idh/MocA family oxidoreductase, partial [Acidobacteriota bacterium]|nr:Gfo/Idh/MocA family oxidoreductase [Acidobacteriota bacterium]
RSPGEGPGFVSGAAALTRALLLTRRFLLTATAGATLPAQEADRTPVRLPRRIRLGIIGFDGHVGEILRVLPRLPDVELVAVADAGSDPAGEAAYLKNPFVSKAHRYRTAAEMLNRERLDLAAVCNNDGERASAILACTESNLNVIAEKPLATTRADFGRVCAAVKARGVHVGMLLPMRFDPPYLALKQIAGSGELGEVAQIDAQKSYQLGTRPEWQKHNRTYGSTILWIGIHMIDLMTWTTGRKFTSAASYQSRVGFPELGDMQNVTATVFRLDNGGTATLRMDYLRPATAGGHGDDRLRLAGTKGIAEYQESTGVTVLTAESGKRILTTLPPQGSVFIDFLQSVYAGRTPALSWTEIVEANEFTLMAQEATRL